MEGYFLLEPKGAFLQKCGFLLGLTGMGCLDWEMVHLGRWIKIVRTS
jgi:hypothetical protein